MNYIYTNKANNHKYILVPEITLDDKVCIRDMANNSDKFVKPATLKKNYSKRSTDKEIIEVQAFTGMFIGLFELTPINFHWMVTTKTGRILEFDVDGHQTNAKNSKYGNKLNPNNIYDYNQGTLDWVLN